MERHLPHIGLRTVKTGLAVALALFFADLRSSPLPIFAAIGAIVAMSRTVGDAFETCRTQFFGILLGAGGLVRAYTQGAAMALNAAQVAVMHPTQRLLVDVPYPLLGRFEHFLKSAPVRVEDKAFTDTITFTLCVRSADAEAFQRDLVQHTDGRCEPLVMEEFHAPWPEEDNAAL